MPRQHVSPLLKLKAFGLVVKGGLTYYQIAERLGVAGLNPSTAASRARHAAHGGWDLVRKRKLPRWRQDNDFPSIIDRMWGARLDTYSPEPPPPPPSVLEQLCARLTDTQVFAEQNGFTDVAMALRNMRAAVNYNAKPSRL